MEERKVLRMNRTQYDVVLEHLKEQPLSSMVAFQDYGITRLSAIIFNLRKDGYLIKSEHKQIRNRYGHNTNYVEYTLLRKEC